jgi:hypothetical protein
MPARLRSGPGNVAICMKRLDGGVVERAIGMRHRVGAFEWDQDDASTPLDDNDNQLGFFGSMLERFPPPAGEYRDACDTMVARTGAPLIDHTLFNLDFMTKNLTWGAELAGSTRWPEQGQRVAPSPGKWLRASEYGRGPYVGLLTPFTVPPPQTPGIDGIPGISTLATCATRLLGFRRTLECGVRRIGFLVLGEGHPLLSKMGTRWYARDRALWDRPTAEWWGTRDNWLASAVAPPGLYTAWEGWWADLKSGEADAVVALFGGYVPYLHRHFGLNFNTEHWNHGPACMVGTDFQVLLDDGELARPRRDRERWQPVPALHFHTRQEDPREAVHAGDNLVVISTETLPAALAAITREVPLGTIWAPRAPA